MVLREREREMISPFPLEEEFSLYQKLWDSLDYREKVNKIDTKPLNKKNAQRFWFLMTGDSKTGFNQFLVFMIFHRGQILFLGDQT